jgi:hypothetical protein
MAVAIAFIIAGEPGRPKPDNARNRDNDRKWDFPNRILWITIGSLESMSAPFRDTEKKAPTYVTELVGYLYRRLSPREVMVPIEFIFGTV